MISMTAVAIGFAGMIVLLFLGLHVATALFLTAVVAIQIYFGGSLLNTTTRQANDATSASPPLRRSAARTRASSSSMPNGLVT